MSSIILIITQIKPSVYGKILKIQFVHWQLSEETANEKLEKIRQIHTTYSKM